MRWWLLVVVAAIAACGREAVRIEDLQARLDRAGCDWLVRCGLVDAAADCTRGWNFADLRITSSVVAAVHAGVVDYSGDNATECLAQLESLSCSPVDGDYRVQPSAICMGVLHGFRKVGTQCNLAEECESRRCDHDQACAPGACCSGTCGEPDHRARIGDDCSSYPCAADGWCANGTCVALLPRGTPCPPIPNVLPCEWGYECFGTCKPPKQEGDACEMVDDVPTCGGGWLVCEWSSMTCRRGYLAPGATCVPENDLCHDAYCDASTRKCVERGNVGDPCTTSCKGALYCADLGDGRVCLPRLDDGSPCFGQQDACTSGVCGLDGTCIEPNTCF